MLIISPIPFLSLVFRQLSRLIPLGDRILIKRVIPAAKTAGGILLPDSNNASKMNRGTVLAVGKGFTTRDGTHVPVSVVVGDNVLLPEYGGVKIDIDGEEGFIYRNEEILAKF